MHLTSALLLLTSALAPALTAPAADAKPCIVPLIILTSLPKPFTLAALTSGPSTSSGQPTIPVRLSPPTPTKKEESVPIISNARIASTRFRLVNQTLVADGFTAHSQPQILIFPPPLAGFAFGGAGADQAPLKFSAGYACDSAGKQILKLIPENSKGFAVDKIAEGQQLKIKPNQFAGKAVDVTVKINGGQ